MLTHQWQKSSKSADGSGCVEVRLSEHGQVFVRDTKQAGRGAVLEFTPEEWAVFVASVRDGEFDLPVAEAS